MATTDVLNGLSVYVRDRLDTRDYLAGFGPVSDLDPTAWDAVVPLGLEEQYALLDVRGIEQKALFPSAATMELCDDKLTSAEALDRLGFSNLLIERHTMASRTFPYVAKSRKGDGGQTTHIISSAADEDIHAKFLTCEDVFFQRLIPGQSEYAAHFLIVDGAVHFQRTVHHEMAQPVSIKGHRRAKKLRSRALEHDPFADELAEVLFALNYKGAACIDYKIDNDRPQIMEINPRSGNSLLLHINTYLDGYCAALGLCRPNTAQQQLKIDRRRTWRRRLRRVLGINL